MRTFTFFALCMAATPSFAQVYIGGAAGIDTTLVNKVEVDGQPQSDSGGTAPALAVRAGIGLGERWGAEIEVAHVLTIEQRDTAARDSLSPSFVSVIGPVEPFVWRSTLHIDSEQQVTAVNALGWVSHPIGGRVDLVFVAGAAFNRTEIERRYRFEPVVPPGFPGFPGIPGLPPRPVLIDFEPQVTRLISYGVRPLVGIEARIAFGNHLRVVPGFRMSSVGVGWSLRPIVGVAWMF